jgi:hypothetical protein
MDVFSFQHSPFAAFTENSITTMMSNERYYFSRNQFLCQRWKCFHLKCFSFCFELVFLSISPLRFRLQQIIAEKLFFSKKLKLLKLKVVCHHHKHLCSSITLRCFIFLPHLVLKACKLENLNFLF